ncbi:MAG: hypothetical protein WBF77_03145 [Sulfurimonadaceae bacterium]
MKQISVTLFVLFGLSSALDARIDNYDTKGLKVYTQHCKKCHGNPYKGAAMKKSREWQKLFANDAKKLVDLHKESPEREEVSALVTRKSKIKHLSKFLIQSASDSGVVTSCDGNFCGR